MLLRLRLVIAMRSFRRARLTRKLAIILIGLVILGFISFILFISWSALSFLRSPELTQFIGDPSPLFQAIPTMMMVAMFFGVLLTSFGVLLQALYLSGDMDFLLSRPVPMRAVFLSKLLQAILPNFSLICLFALPVLWGLGAASDYFFLYYPMVLIVLAGLALAAAGLSSLLVMGVVRLFPARRVAELLGFLGAVMSFLCSQSGNLARFENLSPDQAVATFGMLEQVDQGWSPLTWAGRGLVNLGEGNWFAGLGYLTLSLGLVGLVFAICLVASERLYYSGWANIQVVAAKRKASASAVAKRSRRTHEPGAREIAVPFAGLLAAPRRFLERIIPPAAQAIVGKDFLVLRRDLRNMSQLVTPLIFGIVYAFLFLRDGGRPLEGRSEAPAFFLENIRLYFNVAMSLFVGWMLLGRLGGMGFAQEGRSYWLLKSAPLSPGVLLLAKFLVAYLPTIALSLIFLLVISIIQRSSLATLFFNLGVILFSIAGSAGISLAFGVLGARMDWENPRQMQRGPAGCLGALLGMLYIGLSLGLFLGPPLLAQILEQPIWIGQAAGLLLGGVLGVACAVAPPVLVSKRVTRLGEE
jgi:hypothetical protein